MDNSGAQATDQTGPTGLEEALRATPLYTRVGCPDWCSWSLSVDHEHLSDGSTEIVVRSNAGPGLWHELLEVRHAAAPVTPG